MQPLSDAVLFLWIALGPILFATQPKRRAVLIIFIAGFLFLPERPEFPVHEGTPPAFAIRELAFFVTKPNAASYGFLLGLVLFDRARLLRFRPRWFDAPMILWCLCPFFSALTNGDYLPKEQIDGIRPIPGIIQAIQHSMMWGVPYLAGRLYFTTLDDMQALARGLILGGLAYAPLCLVEKVLSPQLHNWTYGYYAHDFSQAMRDGVYRPTVYMEHGLMVGMWMVAATLVAVWSWWTDSVRTLPWLRGQKPLPMGAVVVALLVATLLMKSAGALALGIVGAGILFAAAALPMRLALTGLMLMPFLYIAGRVPVGFQPTGWLSSSLDDIQAQNLKIRAKQKPMFVYSSVTMLDAEEFLTRSFNKDRAESMIYRIAEEDKLLEKTALRPWFGWGGEGRGRLFNPRTHKNVSIVDGLWILTFSDRGFFGLACLCLAVLLPAARFTWTYPASQWAHPGLAPAAVLAVILVVWMIDNISNAMIDPLFILGAGALTSVTGVRVATWGVPSQASLLPPAEVARPSRRQRGDPAPTCSGPASSPAGAAARSTPKTIRNDSCSAPLD